nr:PREDICTED: putative uncharacterized protein FLJ37770 [Linepithema humile]
MQRSLEQRYAIKFCVKLSKSATDTLEMLRQAYRNKTLSKAQMCKWHKTFKKRREDAKDEQRSGRPSTSRTADNVTQVKSVLNSNRCLSMSYHDNAPSHSSLQVREFLAKKNVAMLPHPPYSPDLAPTDFFCSRDSNSA